MKGELTGKKCPYIRMKLCINILPIIMDNNVSIIDDPEAGKISDQCLSAGH